MHCNDSTDEDRQQWLGYLMDLDIPTTLSADQRLLLGILRQSVIDYYGDDPLERLDAALYFANSWIYKLTLQLFNLPDDLLPRGVDLTEFRRKENMDDSYNLDPLRLETLVRELSGTQLKIMLTMGLLPLPVATRKISMSCQVSRSTALVALNQMAAQGLVMRHEIDGRPAWSLPEEVRAVLEEMWRTRHH